MADHAFTCPQCQHDTLVIDSRVVESQHGTYRRRRRKCPNCGTRSSTYESSIDPRRVWQLEQDLANSSDF